MASFWRFLHPGRLGLTLLGAVCLAASTAQAQAQIGFQANATLYRILVQPGALPQNLTALLDAVAPFPGTHTGPVTVSPDGNWYVFHSGRFAADCQGSNACLTIARGDFASAETITIGGNSLFGEGGQATAGGTAVVYADGGGPHLRDIFLVQKQAGVWIGPLLLTAQSSYAWNYAPRLAPAGNKVIFNAGPSSFPSTAVAEVNLDGTGFGVLVTNLDGPPAPYGSSPAVFSGSRAPDGSLVFEAEWATGGGQSERIWRRSTGGGTPSLVNGTFSNDNSPCVLPDGRIASLYLNAPGANSGLHEIKIMGATGLSDFLLTSNGFIPGFVEVDDVGLGCGPATTVPVTLQGFTAQ